VLNTRPTLLRLELEPTVAMRAGQQKVWQCAQCGLVAVQSSLAAGTMGACPACGHGTWWIQRLPVAGLRTPRVRPQKPGTENTGAVGRNRWIGSRHVEQ
jgi:hypothetical protein